jgi:hypothetical protein
MPKTLVVKLNSRKSTHEEFENSIIEALEKLGLEHDGSDFGLTGEMNRNLYFFFNKEIDFEVLEEEPEIEDD